MFSLLALLACTSDEPITCPPGSHLEDDGLCHLDEDTGTPATGGGLDTDAGPTEPTWSADEALALLDAALQEGLPNTPPVASLYESFMAHREATCPSMENPESDVVYGAWQSDHCETSEGWIFDGLTIYSGGCAPGEENWEEPGVGMLELGMVAQFELTDPDGVVFHGGGNAVHSCRWYEDGSGSCMDQLGGSYGYPTSTGWLGQGVDASLFVDHLWGGEEGRVSTLVGGVGYPGLDLSFDDVVLDWDDCAGRPTGVLRLRDPTGYWHELRFDGDCSGCGSMSWRDLDEGEHCPDLVGPLSELFATWEQPCWD